MEWSPAKCALGCVGLALVAACRQRSSGGDCQDGVCDAGASFDASLDARTDASLDAAVALDAAVDASWPDAGLDWVTLGGGTYAMGSPDGIGESDEHPQHDVTLEDFDLTRSEVTVRQFAQCVDAGACPEPGTDPDDGGRVYCNWTFPDREDHPVNCVSWAVASTFCHWVGGRLPSEAEWEYAARSGGQDILFPWGDDDPSCERAVFNEGGVGCGEYATWPVCSLPMGDSEQGICDLVGNVWEWLADRYHVSYEGAPTNGEPWEEGNRKQWCMRGGGIDQTQHENLRVANRVFHLPDFEYGGMGFRCVR